MNEKELSNEFGIKSLKQLGSGKNKGREERRWTDHTIAISNCISPLDVRTRVYRGRAYEPAKYNQEAWNACATIAS